MLEKFDPMLERVHSVRMTYTGAVCEELQPVEEVGEQCEETSP